MSLTDRIGNGPYTAEDGAAISVLMALAALALERERVLREAQAYAQAAVIDPVSGLQPALLPGTTRRELHRAFAR